MNELGVLQELSERINSKSKSLPKELLKEMGISGRDIESVVLSYDECYTLQIGFVYDNGYDGDEIVYGSFDKVAEYLREPICDLQSALILGDNCAKNKH